MTITTDQIMEAEEKVLASYACKSKNSKGRQYEEKLQDSTRTPFQKDRDRIIHCRAFRRLQRKTQVFVAHYGDHYRNRMTHSIEVAQVARDMARSMCLNEDLAESIAMAHDLGHTPFAHAGQHALNDVMEEHGLKFEHNDQSLRVIDWIEDIYPHFPGLNLSWEVREGLMKHQTPWDNVGQKIIAHPTLEAQIVNMADEIAYNNHDIDDALRAGYLKESDLDNLVLWERAKMRLEKSYGKIEKTRIRWSRTISKMIGILIESALETTMSNLKSAKIVSLEDVYSLNEPLVSFSGETQEQLTALRKLLMEKMYFHKDVLKVMADGQKIIKGLFEVYMNDPNEMPDDWKRYVDRDGLVIAVKDYIAGMTDEFALGEAKRLL